MSRPFSVVALLAAYNEADIVGDVVRDLIGQGIEVYFLDDGSTDGTCELIEPLVGHGVIAVERLRLPHAPGAAFDWAAILRRKVAISEELEADWFIHQDADEFRESPWPQVTLKDAIQRVDCAGYDAIDFVSLDFWPIGQDWQPGTDIRDVFNYYSPSAPYDRLQIRCWKKGVVPVDLDSSGGHEAAFEGRRVFPIRFLSRHYPIRGQAHGERKIFRDRQPRFMQSELARGWHVQYARAKAGEVLVRDHASLTKYDAEAVKFALQINHRDADAFAAQLETVATGLASVRAVYERVAELGAEAEPDGQNRALSSLAAAQDSLRTDLGALQVENAGLRASLRRLHDMGVAIACAIETLQARDAANALELRSLRSERADHVLELNRVRTELEQLTEDAEAVRQEASGLAADCDQLRIRLADVPRNRESLQSELDHARQRLDDVLQSRTWRWTAPVRLAIDVVMRRHVNS